MSQYIATVIDTTGIQPYIFGSNRLRENIGASYLVEQATDDWVKSFFPNENNLDAENKDIEKDKYIERDNLGAELVYTGGGNAVILFQDKNKAIEFTKNLSEKILRKAPGLKIVVAHSEPFEFGNNQLKNIVDSLMQELERKKREYNPSTPLLGLGVTTNCVSSGLPGVDSSEKYGYLVSREIAAKLGIVDFANDKLKKTIFDDIGDYIIPYDVDDLGRTEGISSYIAIVHADGNGMGDRFKEYGNKCENDRDYIARMRNLSDTVNQAGVDALKAVARKVIQLADGELQEKFEITQREGKKYLPIRPIVYGGDDVTFVCDGRLGLSLAALYLQEFQSKTVADGKKLTACAGIAIVKTHYPFARAYQLSEALCRSAKNFKSDEKERLRCEDFSALDWHIAASGLSGTIGEIRRREYQLSIGDLSMRPVYLNSKSDWRNWNDFSEVVNTFNKNENWALSRNKVMSLREKLREGSEKTRQFLEIYKLDEHYLPNYSTPDTGNLNKCGWIDDGRTNRQICGYFDAIEAMEFYISLKEKEKESGD